MELAKPNRTKEQVPVESRFMPAADQLCYEAPCVEMVLTADAVEREIYYAGTMTCGCGEDPWTNIPD